MGLHMAPFLCIFSVIWLALSSPIFLYFLKITSALLILVSSSGTLIILGLFLSCYLLSFHSSLFSLQCGEASQDCRPCPRQQSASAASDPHTPQSGLQLCVSPHLYLPGTLPRFICSHFLLFLASTDGLSFLFLLCHIFISY